MTQSAPWKPVAFEQYDQPKGDEGSRFSLAKVAEYVTRGMRDDRVIAWATHALRKHDWPKTTLGRAEALFEELRSQVGWAPDPADTEHMKAPHLLLGNGVDLAYFGAGDCDDLTIALLAAYLSVAQAVGVKAAVVGQSYSADKSIGHVLGAVWDEKSEKWYYIDPSSDFKLGECLTPFTREHVIEVPSKKVICDADVCLSSPRAVKPVPPTEGLFIGVMGLPDAGEDPIIVFEAPPGLTKDFVPMEKVSAATNVREVVEAPQVDEEGPRALADDAPPPDPTGLPKTFLQGLGEGLLNLSMQTRAMVTDVDAQRLRLLELAGSEAQIFQHGWTPELEALYQEARAAAVAAANFLEEAAYGKRPIAPGEGDDIVIGGSVSDSVWLRIVPKKPGDLFELFQLIDPKTGQSPQILAGIESPKAVWLSAAPVVAAAIPTLPLVVGAIVVVACTVASAYVVTTVYGMLSATAQRAIAAWEDSRIIECIKEKGKDKCPTPKELADAYVIKRKADAELLDAGGTKNSPWLDFSKWAITGAALISIGLGVREFLKEKNRGNSK